jgi:hypothetical protein
METKKNPHIFNAGTDKNHHKHDAIPLYYNSNDYVQQKIKIVDLPIDYLILLLLLE